MRPHNLRLVGISGIGHPTLRTLRGFSGLFLGVVLFFPLTVLAVEKTVPEIQESLPPAQAHDSFDSADVPRDYLSAKITSFATYLDRFFGGDRHYQESNSTVIQMSLSRATGYGGNGKYDFAARLNLSLPETEGKLRLLLETDPEKNVVDAPAKTVVTPAPKVTGSKGLAVATRYVSTSESKWHFHTDGGLKFPMPVHPFVRTALSYSSMVNEWRVSAAESVYWFDYLGVGETTSLNLEHILNEQVLVRATSSVTWLKNTQNFDMLQNVSFYHTLDDRTALVYQAVIYGISNPHYQVSNTVFLVDYRYRLHEKWLFVDLSPQLHFPREFQYKLNHALSMRLEVFFDDVR